MMSSEQNAVFKPFDAYCCHMATAI